ncbi:MAG: metallophosphatase [Candidatus Sumerlaeia bacterium]|nr:metallophosphatase [Candidatus Sumerlaeia bacterium]
MNRREFLRLSALAAAGMAVGTPADLFASPASALRLTLLHTNDVHSHLEPMSTGRYAGLGGAPARSALVNRLRQINPHVLLCDAGDIFQGTAYFNLFEGEPEILSMNRMGYVASAVGNHDFDAGIERLAELAGNVAQFPFIASNYDFADTPMEGLAHDTMVIERDGLRIGLLGLGIKLEGLVSGRLYGATKYLDPIAHAQRAARHLRHEQRCEFIVCLSHANINSAENRDREPGDRDVIREVPEIDVILGGHNHILLAEPERFERPGAAPGWVNQTGWAGTHLGVLQFDVYGRGKNELAAAGPVAAGNAVA